MRRALIDLRTSEHTALRIVPSFLMLAACAVGCSAYDEGLLTGTRGKLAAAGGAAEAPRGPSASQVSATTPAADGGAARCAADAGEDYCAALPALPDLPLIDGQLECGLRLSPMVALNWHGSLEPPGKTASYAAAWRNDGLYLYVEVHGDAIVPHPAEQPIFCGDAIELYVDADARNDDAGSYDATGTMQFVIAAPGGEGAAIETAKFIQGVKQGPWISKALRTTRLPDGYSVEAFIGAADIGLWEWTPSARVGFSVSVDVSGPRDIVVANGCNSRAGQYLLRVGEPRAQCPGEPWCDANLFCRAELRQ
ncbi:MAG TPA: hypothetical protein VJV78_28640 [Polyangiales bacterium]|nr:hypothetical protein [Polyangiales bacterium]